MNTTKPPSAKPRPRIVIAGLGLICPLGGAAWPTYHALCQGASLAQRAAKLPDDIAPVDLVKAVGAVKCAQHTSSDPTVELAQRAAREAAMEANVQLPGLATYLGTSKGAVGALMRAAQASDRARPTDGLAAVLGPHGYLSFQLQRHMGVRPVTHAVAACASSLVALHQAGLNLLHRPTDDDHALVVTAEAALLPLFIHSYQKLGVLAPLRPGEYREQPLGQSRRGFVLSEVAAAVVLQRLTEHEEPAPGQIELVDTATACEGYDMIRPSPQMPALKHVAQTLLRGREVDVIHPHAPGTAEHDPVELAAYSEVLDEADHRPVDLYAAKGALGHGLGAAGLVSLVLACISLRAGRRPPMPWLEPPQKPLAMASSRLQIDPASQSCSRTGMHAVFAAGFAGHVAGTVIKRH